MYVLSSFMCSLIIVAEQYLLQSNYVQPQKTWSLDLHMLVVHFLALSPRLWGKNVILNKNKIIKKK